MEASASSAAEGDMVATLQRLVAQGIPGLVHCEIRDLSGGCGAKFFILVVSSSFEGVGLLDRQKSVHKAIGSAMQKIHAVELKSWTPTQWEKNKVQSAA